MAYRTLTLTLTLTSLFFVFLVGCQTDAPTEDAVAAPPDTSFFQAYARVQSIPPSRSHIVLQHGELNGFMSAMTMPFALADSTLADGFAAGDSVWFQIRVTTTGTVLTDLTPFDRAPSEPTVIGLGRAHPFELTALDGTQVSLVSLSGKVVVLNFWATWCGPCRDEIPEFIRLQDELGLEGVQFVGIALDEEGADIVRPFTEELGVNYPNLIDDGVVSEAYRGHYVVPTTYLIDRRGHMRHRYVGAVTFDTLIPRLRELIRESAPSPESAG